MATEKPINRIVTDLNRALDTLNADLDRVAILTGALAGFSRPVPDYAPGFRHIRQLRAYEIGEPTGGKH